LARRGVVAAIDPRLTNMRLPGLVLLFGSLATSAFAQVPPSESEIGSYVGLHQAAARGDVEAIERGVKSGDPVNGADRQQRTPLHVAIFRKKYDAARALLRLKADPNRLEFGRYDIITIAAVANDLEGLDIAIEGGGDPRAITSVYDGTALIAAAHLGHAEVVRRLIAAGAPLDHVNNLGWTALMESIVLGDGGRSHTETLQALVSAGADVNIADRQGVTPLQHAKQRGFAAMVKILEAAGAR
jgi:ankyrin repeat protein